MRLTERDRRILDMLSHSKGTKEIGEELNLSHRTIGNRIEILKEFLSAKTHAGLVGEAFRNKIIK